MKNKLFSAASAAALSLALFSGAAFAQDLGLMQLQDSAKISMSQLGMQTTGVESLSLEELTEIQAISSGGESDKIKSDRIKVVLADAEERIATGGAVVPSGPVGDVDAADMTSTAVIEANVGQKLAQLGFTDVMVENLSDEQVMQIQNITSSAEPEDMQKQRIERVIAN